MNRSKEMLAALIEGRNLKKAEHVILNLSDLLWLCEESKTALMADPVLLRLSAPLNIVGDIHGQFTDLMKFLDQGGPVESTTYLFLGDYVDRGPNSVETITILLCLKLLYPSNIYLLRGNHETPDISELYGFCEECMECYRNEELWDRFIEVFERLPLAAVISDRIFCVHGGLSQHLQELKQIEELSRPIVVPEKGLISDLLWADPEMSRRGYSASDRGTSFTFGADVADAFLEKNDLDLICRAHQVVLDGFEFPFFPTQSVVTIFSAPDYLDEFGNKGAMLKIAEDLTCSFIFVDPPPGTTPDPELLKSKPV
jgi:serine/threonine-protein phosphatase PP1 catalytic subunit